MIAFVALLKIFTQSDVVTKRFVQRTPISEQITSVVTMKLSRKGRMVTNSAIKNISVVQFNTLTDNKTTLWFLHHRCYLLK